MSTPLPASLRKRYVKRPIPVFADQWFKNGDHPEDRSERIVSASTPEGFLSEGAVVRYFRHPSKKGITPCEKCGVRYHEHGWIDTLEGGHIVCPGDYIITGIAGEHYPCKPDIFANSYEEVQAGTDTRMIPVPERTTLKQGLEPHIIYQGADVAAAVPAAADLKRGIIIRENPTGASTVARPAHG